LVKFIKYAGKVIVSDKDITDAVFMFLKHRDNSNKLFVKNTFQKYKDIKAVRVRDEDMFLEKLKQKCNNNEPFLFGCDSATKATEYYNLCNKGADEETKKKFLLITRKSDFKITDANKQFKDKFVFYSPKITYGVDYNNTDNTTMDWSDDGIDFSCIDSSQDVFIYIKGHTITPFMAFQQTTRCRNIKTLYYYSETVSHRAVYETVDDVKQAYHTAVKSNNRMTEVCATINKDDQEVLIENMFFDLYCYYEYLLDVYATNKRMHFQQILRDEGFVLSEVGEPKKLSKDVRQQAQSISEQHTDELFEEYLNSDNRADKKFINLQSNAEAVGLTYADTETMKTYKDLITDNYNVETYFKTVATMRTDDYLNNKLADIHNKNFECNTMHTTYNQVKLIRLIEQKYNITPFDLNNSSKDTIEMTDEDHKLFQTVFRSRKRKPTDRSKLIQMYAGMLQHIMGHDIIQSKQIRKKERRGEYDYTLVKKDINRYLTLWKMNNSKMEHMKEECLKVFEIDEKFVEEYKQKQDEKWNTKEPKQPEPDNTTSTECPDTEEAESIEEDTYIDPLDVIRYDSYDGCKCEIQFQCFKCHTMSCKCKGYADVGSDRCVCSECKYSV